MKVTLTHYTNNPVEAIEEAACNCYDSKPTNGKIMKACYESGHYSVLEFCDFTFHIEGISRACGYQLVRHRMASFAQRSQRYCAESNFNYVLPPSIKKRKCAMEEYQKIMDNISVAYNTLQDLGISNEDARMVLPNACETTIEVKMNLRELIHFMNERLCARAQWEIRELALEMRKQVLAQTPELESYLVPKCERYSVPFCPEKKSCGRHTNLTLD